MHTPTPPPHHRPAGKRSPAATTRRRRWLAATAGALAAVSLLPAAGLVNPADATPQPATSRPSPAAATGRANPASEATRASQAAPLPDAAPAAAAATPSTPATGLAVMPMGNVPPGAPAPVTAGPMVTSAPVWFPLRGTWVVGCTWSNCGGHHGRPAIDFATDRMGSGSGAPVYAAGAGLARVVARNDGCNNGGDGQGNAVEVDHGNGVRSVYMHLASIAAVDGTWVDPDTVLGTVGSTGYSSPCSFNHLHFEVQHGGTSVDPGPLWACVDGNATTHPSGNWATIAQWTAMRNDGTGCVVPPGVAPVGNLEVAESPADNTVRVSGWAFDPDQPGAPVAIAMRWRGPVGGRSTLVPVALTSVLRTDVAASHPAATPTAGFDLAVDVPVRARTVEVYAIDDRTGTPVLLAERPITVHRPAPTGPGWDLPDWLGVGGLRSDGPGPAGAAAPAGGERASGR